MFANQTNTLNTNHILNSNGNYDQNTNTNTNPNSNTNSSKAAQPYGTN